METKANYVAVGAFVLACVIGLVVTILWLAGVQYSQEYAYYQAYFKGPVTGLGKGTVTRYNGIEVGRITDLAFDPADPQPRDRHHAGAAQPQYPRGQRRLDRQPGPDRRRLCRNQRRHAQVAAAGGRAKASAIR